MWTEEQKIRTIFGLKVKQLRTNENLSQSELSERCGLSISYLNEIEKGKKYPKPDKIMALAEGLDTPYDELVSLKLGKKLKPVSDLFSSGILKTIPLEKFGLDPGKLVEMISEAPVKMNAFLSTIFRISRNYAISQEHFYFAALRSYQEMHDNYFGEIEDAVDKFRSEHKLPDKHTTKAADLRNILENEFGYTIDFETLQNSTDLKGFRSVFNPNSKTLYISSTLNPIQIAFLYGREIAFNSMGLKERPYFTALFKVNSFDEALNNFFASYFSVALLINRELFIADLKEFFDQEKWNLKKFEAFQKRYSASPEMFFHRLTNILPQFFGLQSIFFLRFSTKPKSSRYFLSKELHLSRMHFPHGNEKNEHYCRRWVALGSIMELSKNQNSVDHSGTISMVQRSKHLHSGREYLIFSIARADTPGEGNNTSVSIGIELDVKLKRKIKFWNDPKIQEMEVNETCERCELKDCKERAAPPTKFRKKQKEREILEKLNGLISG